LISAARMPFVLQPTITPNHNLSPSFNVMSQRKVPLKTNSDGAALPSEFVRSLVHHLKAGFPCLYLVSSEEQRVEAELRQVAQLSGFQLYFWTTVSGLVDAVKATAQDCLDPLEALTAIGSLPEKSVVLLKDFHLYLQDPNPILLRQLKDTLAVAKTKNRTLVILGCRLCLPPELEREVTVLEFNLPNAEHLNLVLNGILESEAKIPQPTNREAILAALSGLTTQEAENALALSFIELGQLDPVRLGQLKAQSVKKQGLVELVERVPSLDRIGGLDRLKHWLLKRRKAFTQEAKAFGLPSPSGLLILGLPGTGKSMTAKATASVFGVPLLRLDAGKLFAGLVGASEANLRSVLQTAEAIAPCCLWVDELEKALAGSQSSGSTDGGTTARILGSLLSWMQEKTAPVFVVATANDVSKLPPELLRKGRFDEVFFVDLPNEEEREEIWRIVISDYDRDPADFDLKQLAKATEGFTGGEIRFAFFDALFEAFEAEAEPDDLGIARVLAGSVPLSKLMAEPIQQLRQWARNHARPATSPLPDPKGRALVV
jgi:hypothetical protein